MKWLIILLLICFCFGTITQAQNYTRADAVGSSVPAHYSSGVDSLAIYLQHILQNDEERVRAAYRWVTQNIRYDKDSMLYINWSLDAAEKLEATMRRRKGVCDNFATVFTALLHKMQIPSFIVNGLTHGHPQIAHSWNAVQLGHSWLLCDPTWDINYRNETSYFLLSPSQFLENHWPFDPMWQLKEQPLSLNAFERRGRGDPAAISFPAVQDTITRFLGMDSLQQLEATAARIAKMQDGREILRIWGAYNEMNIAIIYGERDMLAYNAAVEKLNAANRLLNRFIAFRNAMFIPAKADAEVAEMLHPVAPLLSAARDTMAGIGVVRENFQYDEEGLKQRISSAEKKLKQCKAFLETYLRTSLAGRPALFYE